VQNRPKCHQICGLVLVASRGLTGAMSLLWRHLATTHRRPPVRSTNPVCGPEDAKPSARGLGGPPGRGGTFVYTGVAGLISDQHYAEYRHEIQALPLVADIAHLAETRFGVCTSAFLTKPPRTPKELGFGGFRPSKLRLDIPFGLKTSASWRNGISDCRTFVPLVFGLTDFYFSWVICCGSSSQD
jgi:hypothetical protein